MNEIIKDFSNARQVSFDAVITGWLGAGGLGSFYPDIGFSKPVPDTVKARYDQFVSYGDLFLRFIPHCDWFEVRFDATWFSKVRLIDESSWKHESSGGERLLAKRTDLTTLPQEHLDRINQLRLRKNLGDLLDRKAVLFGHSPSDEWSILDGNHRLLALACQHLIDKCPLDEFSIFVGFSFGPCRWHGDPVVWQERPERTAGERRYVLKTW